MSEGRVQALVYDIRRKVPESDARSVEAWQILTSAKEAGGGGGGGGPWT